MVVLGRCTLGRALALVLVPTEVPSRTVSFVPVEVAESVKARVVEARAEVAVAQAPRARVQRTSVGC